MRGRFTGDVERGGEDAAEEIDRRAGVAAGEGPPGWVTPRLPNTVELLLKTMLP